MWQYAESGAWHPRTSGEADGRHQHPDKALSHCASKLFARVHLACATEVAGLKEHGPFTTVALL
jgi:hypothetical protein